jgi:hypothetical protein
MMATEPTTGAGWSIRSTACHSSRPLTRTRPTELKTLAERSRCLETPVRQDERQIEQNQRHLVGEIVHAVHE